jgi:hypothetical protein
MACLAIGIASEDRRIFHLRTSGLLAMHFIVQADTENLVGIGNDRQPFDVAERRGCRGSSCLGNAGKTGCHSRFEIGVARRKNRAGIEKAIVLDDAPGRTAGDLDGGQSHGFCSCRGSDWVAGAFTPAAFDR